MALTFLSCSYSYDSGPMSSSAMHAIILHDTEGHEAYDLYIFRTGAGRGVSIHFYVTHDGRVYKSVPMSRGANHAGFGHLPNGENPNDHSIGIELEHVGSGPYPEAQLNKLDALIAYIDAHFGKRVPIFGHRDVDPGRKSDPNPPFPLTAYKQNRRHTPVAVKDTSYTIGMEHGGNNTDMGKMAADAAARGNAYDHVQVPASAWAMLVKPTASIPSPLARLVGAYCNSAVKRWAINKLI